MQITRLPSIEWQKDQYKSGDLGVIRVWSINDSWESLEHVKLGATLSHTNPAGKKILDETRQYHFNQTADSKRLIREWSLSDLKPGHYELQAVIQSKDGEILGENSFQFDISPASREIEIKNATL